MVRTLSCLGLALVALLILPALALAQDEPSLDQTVIELNTTWVMVAAILVMFMQAGFAFLEIGFSRAFRCALVSATAMSLSCSPWGRTASRPHRSICGDGEPPVSSETYGRRLLSDSHAPDAHRRPGLAATPSADGRTHGRLS